MKWIELNHTAGSSLVNFDTIIYYNVSNDEIVFVSVDGGAFSFLFSSNAASQAVYDKLKKLLPSTNLDQVYV